MLWRNVVKRTWVVWALYGHSYSIGVYLSQYVVQRSKKLAERDAVYIIEGCANAISFSDFAIFWWRKVFFATTLYLINFGFVVMTNLI